MSRQDTEPARSERTRQRQRALTEAARTYLEEHYRERVPLGELAARFGVSPGFLSRVFHRHAGIAMHRYQIQLRLEQARGVLLAGRADDLTELALDLGFACHGHFTDTFRREFGCPPSALRPRKGTANTVTVSIKQKNRSLDF